MVVVDEVNQDRADVVAEAAFLRIGPAEIAAKEAQGEFLEQLLGRFLITQAPPSKYRCTAEQYRSMSSFWA